MRTGQQHNPVLMTPQHLNHTVILQQEKQASRLGPVTFDTAYQQHITSFAVQSQHMNTYEHVCGNLLSCLDTFLAALSARLPSQHATAGAACSLSLPLSAAKHHTLG